MRQIIEQEIDVTDTALLTGRFVIALPRGANILLGIYDDPDRGHKPRMFIEITDKYAVGNPNEEGGPTRIEALQYHFAIFKSGSYIPEGDLAYVGHFRSPFSEKTIMHVYYKIK